MIWGDISIDWILFVTNLKCSPAPIATFIYLDEISNNFIRLSIESIRSLRGKLSEIVCSTHSHVSIRIASIFHQTTAYVCENTDTILVKCIKKATTRNNRNWIYLRTNHAKPIATLWFSTVDSNAVEHSNWIKFQLLEQTLHLFNSELKQNLLDCHCHIWLKRQKRNPLIHTVLSNKNHKTITKQQQSEPTTKHNRLKRRKIGKPLQNFFVCVHSFFFYQKCSLASITGIQLCILFLTVWKSTNPGKNWRYAYFECFSYY